MHKPKILMYDPNETARDNFAEMLERRGGRVVIKTTVEELIKHISQSQFEAILLCLKDSNIEAVLQALDQGPTPLERVAIRPNEQRHKIGENIRIIPHTEPLEQELRTYCEMAGLRFELPERQAA